jgi:hypothetical protein
VVEPGRVFVARVRRVFAGLVSVLVVGGVMLLGASGASAGTPCGSSGTFSQPGSTATCSYAAGVSDTFTVPVGVTQVLITAVGGHGGAAYSGDCSDNICTFTLVDNGGSGAIVTSSVAVNPSDTLGVTVATDGAVGPGPDPAPLYYGEGGSGAGNGGDGYKLFGSGGGGGSAVFSGAAALVVAGGGGGAGGCGDGGDASQDAVPNQAGCSSDIGFAGTQTAPGAGASLCAPNYPDAAGSGMNGGTGQGGGGGGGYFGGGAGCDGGGGGGSSYPNADVTGYDSTGTPSMTISYTVPLATPSIGTSQQPGSATVGTSIADQATVSEGDSPSGTVTFNLYSNSGGTGTPLFTDADVALSSGVATSTGYTATATGTDYWVATYNGNTNNNSVTSGTSAEPVSITPASPTINTTQQPSSATVGTSIADQATVSGGYNPSGTVTFNLYSNSGGTGTPLFTDADVALSSGVATSTGYTATATGTDYWVATYNGNTNNNSVTSGTSAEPVTITAATSLTAAPQLDLRAPRLSVGLGRVSATLTSAGSPVPGEPITFTVGATTLCTANTNTSGVATCNLSLKNELRVLFANSYKATFTANGSYLGSTATTQAIVF